MNKLFFILVFLSQNVFAADDVGRVKLVLPQGEWVTDSKIDTPLVYGGDSLGSISSQRLVKVLVNDKIIQALLFVSAGDHGLTKGHMEWSDRCKQKKSEYRVDATNGSFTRLDCLRVYRSMQPAEWLKKYAQKTYDELTQSGYTFASNGYQITHKIGTDNGTFIFSNMLIARSVLAGIPSAKKGATYAGMPGVAWGHQYADAARSSVTSLSGELVMPAVSY